MLGACQEALSIRKIANLFLGGSLSDVSNLVYLILSFTNRTHFDAGIVVRINPSEVRGELLVEDVWSQVLLPLNELQIV